MAARVMLLILAVGVFIALWFGDHRSDCESPTTHSEKPAEAIKPKHHTSQRNQEGQLLARAADFTSSRIVSMPPVVVLLSETDEPTVWKTLVAWCAQNVADSNQLSEIAVTDAAAATVAEIPALQLDRIPLPGGITPGDYRIVCSNGDVTRLMITADELSRRELPADESPKSFYQLHDGRRRWYFIRIETDKTHLTTIDDAQSPVMAAKPAVVAPKPRPNGFPPGWWSQPLPTQPLSTARQWIVEGAVQVQNEMAAATMDIIRRWQDWTSSSMQKLRQAARMTPRLSAEPGSTRR